MVDRTAILAGLALGGALALPGLPNLQLAAVLGVTYAFAGWQVARRWRVWNTGGVWAGAFSGLVSGAALLGVNSVTVVPDHHRFALGLLVIGVGVAAAGTGIEIALAAIEKGRLDAEGVAAQRED